MVFETREDERIKAIDKRYSISDLGVVYSGGLPLAAIDGWGVNLYGKRVKIAYLVARAFVPNPECRQWLRHKNGDVRDNRASNLEWSDWKEERRRGPKPTTRWVKAWNLDGEVVGIWKCPRDGAEATGTNTRAVRAAASGLQKTAGGLLWRYLQ